MAVPPNLLTGFFQQGYLTRDLNAALRYYRDRLGVRDFLTFDTRSMNADSSSLVALAWIGPMMVELIQPIGAPPPVYADLPDEGGPVARFHHFGFLCDEEEAWRAALAGARAQDIPIPVLRENSGTVDLFYADARAQIGHHLEYVLVRPPARAFWDSIPRNN